MPFERKILTNAELLDITFGYVDYEEIDGALRFYKCTREQTDAFWKLSDNLGAWSLRTTGIRLDFVTSSPYFSFKTVEGTKYELFINGVKDTQIELEIGEEFFKELSVAKGLNRITLIFPSHDAGAITDVCLEEGAIFHRYKHTFDKKILFIGDSITQGWDTACDSNSYAYQITLRYDADTVIFGVGGAYFHGSIAPTVDNYHPDVVIIAYGANDYGKGREALVSNMHEFLDKTLPIYKNSKVVGISPIWYLKANEDFEEFCALIRSIYAEYGVETINGFPLIPHSEDCFADKWHPNDKGYLAYADKLIPILSEIIGA